MCIAFLSVRLMSRIRPAPTSWRSALAVILLSACGPADIVDPDLDGRVEPVAKPAAVRGIYVNAQAAGTPSKVAELVALARDSGLNTFVIDVKERGEVSYASEVPLVDAVGAGRVYIEDLPGLLRTLKEAGIYPIARIVCFRDAVLAAARPDLAIRTVDDRLWLDPESDKPWVDPYHPEVQAYNIDLAREALEAGFAEVQWDYVRFPDVSAEVRAEMVFPAQGGVSAPEAIRDFIALSKEELADFDVPVTADVFGRVITTYDDSGIGQDWNDLVQVTDVLLPMVYPSLYWPGSLGIDDPDGDPYGIVRAAMDSAVVRMERTDGAQATLRPWLQAFSLGGITYGAEEMRAQIQAVEDAGLEEWLFWNPDAVYPAAAF